jgi:hypothetical protein
MRERRSRYEPILVDDGSTDSSLEIAHRFSGRVLRSAATRGPASARNRGAQKARADPLFLDADVLCLPRHSGQIREVRRESRPAAVIGRMTMLLRIRFPLALQESDASLASAASPEAPTFWTGAALSGATSF